MKQPAQTQHPHTGATGHLRDAAQHAQWEARDASDKATDIATQPWAVALARFGYAAKGVVYVLMGGIAARFAVGAGGVPTDTKGAIRALYYEPFGHFLLVVIAAGLAGYALWNLARAVLDLDYEGTKPQAILKRIGFALIAFSYLGLGAAAAQLALGHGNGGKSSDEATQDWTARFLNLPAGVPLVVLGGLIMLAIAASVAYEGWSGRFMRRIKQAEADRAERDGIRWLGHFGLLALAVVLAEIGAFLVVAALRHNPGEAKGLGGALLALATTPLGPLLLGVVAAGLVAYGVYSFGQARYRRIGPA